MRRRKHLIRGILLGSAAIGLPALFNSLVTRRARRLAPMTWGSGDRYAWRHGEIIYQQLGAGLPLLLLHSFGTGHSAAEWRRTAEILSGSYRVFAPDLLGWGHSAKPPLTYDSTLYIRLISDFLEEVVAEPAVIVAAGLSAAYGVQVAADQPARVRALALLVPHGIEQQGDEPDFRDALMHRLLRLPVIGTSALNLYTSHAGIGAYLQREVYATPGAVDEALVEEHYRSSHQRGSHAALAAYWSGYLGHGVREAVGRLQLPVWIAWGRHATSPPVETADLWLHALASAELEILEQCGLLPHAESPAELCRKLELFLADLDD